MVVAACGGGSGGSSVPTTSGARSGATQGAQGTQGTQSTQTVAPGDIQTGETLTIPLVTTLDLTLDPARGINSLTLAVLMPYIYGGLLVYDKDAHPVKDLAESFQKSPDGLTWTFIIRKDAKFASDRQVTADDFIYSWERALDPKQTSPASSFMEHLAGFTEYTKGQADHISGVKKIDDQTLQLTLSRPYNFFTSYLAVFPWFVVDHELVEKYGARTNTDWSAHTPYGTGPWKVSKFDPASVLELVPNEHYYDKPSPSVTKVSFPILRGPVASNTALNLYKSGQAQVVPNFPLSLLDAVEKDFKDQIQWILAGGVDSIAMNFAKKPFDNVLVRRAFGLAIDRNTLDNTIWRGTLKPTTAFTIPQVPDYTPPLGLDYNPDEAKKEMAAAGYPGGKGLPPITMYVAAETSSEDVNRWRALADMWNKTLGTNVQINTALTADQITTKRQNENGLQIAVAGWISPTPQTPQQISQAMRSDSPYMKGYYNWGIQVPAMTYNGVKYDPTADSKTFDGLVRQADVEQDPAKRNDLYHQAETLFLKDAVYAPFGNFRYPSIIKPNVKGLVWGGLYYSLPMPINKNVVVTKG